MSEVSTAQDEATRFDATHDDATRETLLQIARQHGTPAYAFDVQRLRTQANRLQTELPDAIDVFYSLKANASLGICDVFADCGLGADVASAGELATAVEAGFPASRLFVAGPCKSHETWSMLRSLPEAIISIDSPSELSLLAGHALPNPVVLRLRPGYESCAIVAAGAGSRFGVPQDELPQCREIMDSGHINLIGFHVFAGSQVLESSGVIDHLRRGLDLSLQASEALRFTPEFLNLGGGFGIPYGAGESELDLAAVSSELESIIDRAGGARVALELGRYLVAQAGWYLTSVLAHQTHGCRPAVVVDGGTHQRADMCGMNLRQTAAPPLVLTTAETMTRPTDILGCLSLPADVMSEAGALPKLSVGDVLAWPTAGAYGVWASPAVFHATPLPAEVAFDGASTNLMRAPKPARSILDDQLHITTKSTTTDALTVG
jgi:diaminopimelate decarboxylase